MGRPKGLLKLGSSSLIEKAVSDLDEICDIVLVAAGHHYHAIREATQAHIAMHPVVDWHHGMRSSLRSGLRALPDGHVLVRHVDQPGIKYETLRRLCAGRISRPRVLAYRGQAGHPVLIPNWLRPVITGQDQRSLRQIFNEVGIQKLHIDDAAITRNLNRREDWERFLFEFR